MHIALDNGHDSIIQHLLENGANVNSHDIDSHCTVVKNGQESIVQLLQHHGADVNFTDINGFRPLFKACKNEHESVVQFLLKLDQNPWGMTMCLI